MSIDLQAAACSGNIAFNAAPVVLNWRLAGVCDRVFYLGNESFATQLIKRAIKADQHKDQADQDSYDNACLLDARRLAVLIDDRRKQVFWAMSAECVPFCD